VQSIKNFSNWLFLIYGLTLKICCEEFFFGSLRLCVADKKENVMRKKMFYIFFAFALICEHFQSFPNILQRVKKRENISYYNWWVFIVKNIPKGAILNEERKKPFIVHSNQSILECPRQWHFLFFRHTASCDKCCCKSDGLGNSKLTEKKIWNSLVRLYIKNCKDISKIFLFTALNT
jgi:hypothetical protein